MVIGRICSCCCTVPPPSPTFVPQNIVNIQLTFVSIRQKNICQWLSIGQTLQNTVHKTCVPQILQSYPPVDTRFPHFVFISPFIVTHSIFVPVAAAVATTAATVTTTSFPVTIPTTTTETSAIGGFGFDSMGVQRTNIFRMKVHPTCYLDMREKRGKMR